MNVPQGGESWRALARRFSVFPVQCRIQKPLFVRHSVNRKKLSYLFENASIILQRTVNRRNGIEDRSTLELNLCPDLTEMSWMLENKLQGRLSRGTFGRDALSWVDDP